MRAKITVGVDVRSVFLGALLGIVGVALLGASGKDDSCTLVAPLRFLVLESAPKEDAAQERQAFLVRVCPHYGKIDHDALNFRLENETQELTMLVSPEPGCEIRRGDILSFDAFHHLKLSPGSRVIRHLPSGGQELVP